MAYAVFDKRRGTWTVRWNDGKAMVSETITSRPPKGWTPGCSRPREPQAVLEAKAARAKQEIERRRGGGVRIGGVTIREFLQARQDFCVKRGSVRSAEVFADTFGRFATWCEARAVCYAVEVTAEHCHTWIIEHSQAISKQTGLPRAYASLKRDRALLSAAWNQFVRLGRFDKNPWLPVDVPGKPNRTKRGSWSPEELEAILAVCRQYLQDFLVIGCHTGLRIAALLGLEWRDVKFHSKDQPGYGTVTVRKELGKGGKGYVVPMSRRCHDVLRRMMDSRDRSPFVIKGLKGKPITCRSTTAMAIRLACARAGLPAPISPNHQLRRTFGRQAVLGQLTGRPVPLYVVSQWMGHSSVKMTEQYLDMSAESSHDWMSDD